MSKHRCYICGKDPAAGYASIWSAKDGERWYCHGDDDEDLTCYMQGSWRITHPPGDPTVPATPDATQAIEARIHELRGEG